MLRWLANGHSHACLPCDLYVNFNSMDVIVACNTTEHNKLQASMDHSLFL